MKSFIVSFLVALISTTFISAAVVRNGFEMLEELKSDNTVRVYKCKHARYPFSVKLLHIRSGLTPEELKLRQQSNTKIAEMVRKETPRRQNDILIVEESIVDDGEFMEVMDGNGLQLNEFLVKVLFNDEGKQSDGLQAEMEYRLMAFISQFIKMERYWRIKKEIGGLETPQGDNIFVKVLDETGDEYIIQLMNAKLLNEEGELVDPKEGNLLANEVVKHVIAIYRDTVGKRVGYSSNFGLLTALFAKIPLDSELDMMQMMLKQRCQSPRIASRL